MAAPKLLEDDDRLPGTDAFRALLLIAFGMVYASIFVLSPPDIPPSLQRFFIITNIVAAGLSGVALAQGSLIRQCNPDSLLNVWVLFRPKLLSSLGALSFLLFLSVAVFSFGGVLASPFAALLALSQVFYLFEVLEKTDEGYYGKIIARLDEQRFSTAEWRKNLRAVRSPDYLGLLIAFLTLVLAGVPLVVASAYEVLPGWLFLPNALRSQTWYLSTGFFTFYIGAVAALFAALPLSLCADLQRRVFGGSTN